MIQEMLHVGILIWGDSQPIFWDACIVTTPDAGLFEYQICSNIYPQHTSKNFHERNEKYQLPTNLP